jgi:hypothetical protein
MIKEKVAKIPPEYSWAILRKKSGTDLTEQYMEIKGDAEHDIIQPWNIRHLGQPPSWIDM